LVQRTEIEPRPALLRYGMAVFVIALAVAGRALVQHYGGSAYRFPIFQLAIIAAALYGSWGPGLLAVLLATIAWAWFITPAGSFRVDQLADLLNILAVAAVNILIVWGFSIARREISEYGRSEPGTPKQSRWTRIKLRSLNKRAERELTPKVKPRRAYRGSRLTLGCLCAVALLLAIFGTWGTFTTAGTTYFDDEAWLVPLFCLAMAPAILIFGVGFLPVYSFERNAPQTGWGRTGQ